MAVVVTATLTSVSPLKVTMLGDTVSVPATKLTTYTPASGDVGTVVRVEIRRGGLLPIVQGRVG